MNVALFEVCRSPQVVKPCTEAIILSRLFERLGIDYELWSNDGIWPNQIEIDSILISESLAYTVFDIVHLAVHGEPNGLILRWSTDDAIEERRPEEWLSGEDIRQMSCWDGKVIVSGACSSSILAADFLDAGASAVVAPPMDVSWPGLGAFFEVFYRCLHQTLDVANALEAATREYPAYRGYRCFQVPA